MTAGFRSESPAGFVGIRNPIERIFAKLKALLRTAAARTVPELWHAIRQAFARFTADECRNSLAAAGYETDLAVAM